jgi:hypothetical protein
MDHAQLEKVVALRGVKTELPGGGGEEQGQRGRCSCNRQEFTSF